jgi:hypothetical protein
MLNSNFNQTTDLKKIYIRGIRKLTGAKVRENKRQRDSKCI